MVGNRVTEIEQLRQQEENNMVQWNQLLGEKDSQILELQDKLDSLLQPRMNSARSRPKIGQFLAHFRPKRIENFF